MMIARRLERLQFLSEIIARRVDNEALPTRGELEWLLEIGDSAITYRTRYRAAPEWNSTIDLLVYDHRNPRALAFQWQAIESLLVDVAESLGYPPQDTLKESIAKLTALQGANLGGDLDAARASRQKLSLSLMHLNSAAALLSDQLTSQHFSHVDFELRAVSA